MSEEKKIRHKWDRAMKFKKNVCTICGCVRDTFGLYPKYILNGERFDYAPTCIKPQKNEKDNLPDSTMDGIDSNNCSG